jgi:acyl-CoA synthetase (NDP forming)
MTGSPWDTLTAMLEARSVALVGASPRAGSLGARMIEEVAKSPSQPRTYLVNPRYRDISGAPCHPSFAALPEPVDLALLAVPDAALEEQVRAAAASGARSAVIFGSAVDVPPVAGAPPRPAFPGSRAHSGTSTEATGAFVPAGGTATAGGLRDRIAAVARDAGMAVCGAGCMGFVNVARGLRAIGYTEPDPLPAGPVALVTHSGSVFSALLRTRRAFGFTLAVSSGQELVTPAAAYAKYALTLPETKVLALVLEAIRDAAALRAVLGDAAARDLPVLLLTAGASAASRPLVAAHSGALAAGDGAWQALASAYGVHRASDLAELADTLELFALAQRPRRASGLATVHDSGFERAHVADVAAAVGVPFAPIGADTKKRLAAVLDPGLEPGNPLDVWGTGRDQEVLFTETLCALADDPAVGAVALAVDLVPEYDGDESYRTALLAAAAKTSKPLAVLASIPAAIDQEAAALLRNSGIPVLESTRTGLQALRHLLAHAPSSPSQERESDSAPGNAPQARSLGAGQGGSAGAGQAGSTRAGAPPVAGGTSFECARRALWSAALAAGSLPGADLFAMLRDYGIPAVSARSAATRADVLDVAADIGYPVALKTDMPDISHKSDVGGVRLGIADPAELAAAYADLSARLGPRVTVTEMAAPGQELLLGMARDPALGPLIVVGAGGVLAEHLAERAVALPPLTSQAARNMLDGLRSAELFKGVRGQPACDRDAIAAAIVAFATLVADLGEHLTAFEVNPVICSPAGVLAVDALAIWPAHDHEGYSAY